MNDNDWCPEYPINSDCLVNWDPQSDNCAYDCNLARVNCVQDCDANNGDYGCYETCKNIQDSCLRDCICYENCPNGCDLPPFNTTCPSWDAYCPATEPVTTTEILTTTEGTTLTTASTLPPSGEIGPPGPPIEAPEGDMILIVSDDKAMLHNWPKGGEEYFFELQGSYQDFNSKFDFNGEFRFHNFHYIIHTTKMTTLFQDTGSRIRVLSNSKANPTLLVVPITVPVVTKIVNTLMSKDPLSSLLKMEAVVLISSGMVLPMAKNCHSI